MVADPEVTSTSFHDQFSAALGRMTGGMMAEGSEEEINGSTVLVLLQAIASEAGIESIILGAQPAIDGKSTFAAMHDGEIWRIQHRVDAGQIVTEFAKPTSDEVIKDCSGIDGYGDLARVIVAQTLAGMGRVEQNDSVSGHVLTDAHAAIRGHCLVHGKLIVNVGESKAIRCAVEFTLDAPAGSTPSPSHIRMTDLTEAEANEEIRSNQEAMGVTNPFPVKTGQA